MKARLRSGMCVVGAWLAACGASVPPPKRVVVPVAKRPAPIVVPTPPPRATRPSGWGAPQVLVHGSFFHGVHGLALDPQGRLLAGTRVGGAIWEVDRANGNAQVLIPAPEGEADDIAVGPNGELAWTSSSQGIVRFRANEADEIREVAHNLRGIRAIAFDPRGRTLYASQIFVSDALWQLDVEGKLAPRQVADGLGGLDGLDVGAGGQIYGSLGSKGQVVEISPQTGEVKVITSELVTPTAAKLDHHGDLWVLDAKDGTLNRIDPDSGEVQRFADLASGLDNLTIAPDGMIYVSNASDNSVQSVHPGDGEVTTLTRGDLAAPAGMKLDGNILYIADVFAFRAVDPTTGAVRDLFRADDAELRYPGAVGVGGNLLALASWSSGTVELVERASHRRLAVLRGFHAPCDALPLEDGSVLVAEAGTGELTRVSGKGFEARAQVTDALPEPAQMVLGRDGSVYVTQAAGHLTRVDLSTGATYVVVEGLEMPEGLAETGWGTFMIAESAAQRLVEVDPSTGEKQVIAGNLPIGLRPGWDGPPRAYLATGVAVDHLGNVYMTADRDNSLLRIPAEG